MPYRTFADLPLLRVILPFLAGILLFSRIEVPAIALWIAFIGSLFLTMALHTWWRLPRPLLVFCCFQLTVFLGSGALTRLHLLPEQPDHFSRTPAQYLLGHIQVPPEEKAKSYKVIIQVDSLIDSSSCMHKASGKLLLYLQKDSSYKMLRTGDKILLPANYREVEGPKNPGQFDYRNFLQHKYIYHQGYLRQGELIRLTPKDRYALRRWSQEISSSVQQLLYRYIPGHDEAALADGILLGHRADIEDELYNAFAYTGILHILSVSGLHVGIVYALLALLLKIIPDHNRFIPAGAMRISKFLFILTCIWLFALVTGLGAAVTRAAILFSLLHYGRLSREHTNNINLLCGSAIIQLMIDPMQVYDIGFQLSYLAMLGIFLLSKRIYALYYHPNKLIDWTWQLWSASLAAQVFTLPLSLYYFGNFPTWFLIANIFAIPLSTLILWLSIVLIPLQFIPALALWLGKAIGYSGQLFIRLTLLIAELPLGKVSGLYINAIQVLLIFIALSFFSYYLLQNRIRALIGATGLSLVVVCLSIYHTTETWKQERLVFYSIPKHTVIGWNQGDKQVLFSLDTLPPKPFDLCIRESHRVFHIRQHGLYCLNKEIDSAGIFFKKQLLLLPNQSVYLLDKTNSRLHFESPLTIDHLLITDNLYLNIDQLRQQYRFKKLYLCPDNDNRHLRIYRKLLDEAGISYIDLSQVSAEIPL